MAEITLINRALARIGAEKIDNLDEPGISDNVVRDVWDSVLEDVKSKYPWGFMMRYTSMTRIGEESLTNWKYEFRMPPDREAEPRAYYNPGASDKPVTKFEVSDGKVLTDYAQLTCFYNYKSQVIKWPGYFKELVVLVAAAEFAGAIREDWVLRRELRRNAYGSDAAQGEGGQFGVAANLDAQAHPSPVPDGGRNPLTDAHFIEGDARCGFEDW